MARKRKALTPLQRARKRRKWRWRNIRPRTLRAIVWRLKVYGGKKARRYARKLPRYYRRYLRAYWGRNWYAHIRNLPIERDWRKYKGETDKDKKRARWRSFWRVYSMLISRLQGNRFNRRLVRAYKKAKWQSSKRYKAPKRKQIMATIQNGYKRYSATEPVGNPIFKPLRMITKVRRLKRRWRRMMGIKRRRRRRRMPRGMRRIRLKLRRQLQGKRVNRMSLKERQRRALARRRAYLRKLRRNQKRRDMKVRQVQRVFMKWSGPFKSASSREFVYLDGRSFGKGRHYIIYDNGQIYSGKRATMYSRPMMKRDDYFDNIDTIKFLEKKFGKRRLRDGNIGF